MCSVTTCKILSATELWEQTLLLSLDNTKQLNGGALVAINLSCLKLIFNLRLSREYMKERPVRPEQNSQHWVLDFNCDILRLVLVDSVVYVA